MNKLIFYLLVLLAMAVVGCKDGRANTTDPALASAQGLPQSWQPAQMQTGQAQPPVQVVQQGPGNQVLQTYLLKRLEADDRDAALKAQMIEHQKDEAAHKLRLQLEESEHRKSWLDRFLLLLLVLGSIIGIFVVSATVLFWHNRWMDRNPEDYNKDEFDVLVASPSPTEAQGRMAQAISMGLTGRRMALAMCVAGGSVAVALVLA